MTKIKHLEIAVFENNEEQPIKTLVLHEFTNTKLNSKWYGKEYDGIFAGPCDEAAESVKTVNDIISDYTEPGNKSLFTLSIKDDESWITLDYDMERIIKELSDHSGL